MRIAHLLPRHLLMSALLTLGVFMSPLASADTTAPASAPPKHTALVFGGSGQLGAEVVRALVGAGHNVTVFLRPSSSRERLAGLQVSLIEGNVLTEADVQRAFQTKRYAIVVDALGRSESDVEFFAEAGSRIARWAKATGVDHVILHSSVGVGRSKAVYPPDRYERMSKLFAAKQVGEDAVIASGVRYTIIRNAVLRNLPPDAADGARLIADEMAFGTVSRRGLGRLTLECIDNPACSNRIFHAVDPGMASPER
jgi:uncharacterized protein YbjT (DUF2867 family)